MRALVLVLSSLVAGVAVADVGPAPPRCVVPGSCVTCRVRTGMESGDACVVAALDGGLVKQQCSDKLGADTALHYCPSGTTATKPGCATAPGLVGVALLALSGLARRRRSRS
jgi:MYXO-CTERM domain-containing protein